MAFNAEQFFLDSLKSSREDVEVFASDLWKLLKALGIWAVPFCLSIIVIAGLPAVFVGGGQDFIDVQLARRDVDGAP